jgi:CARDB
VSTKRFVIAGATALALGAGTAPAVIAASSGARLRSFVCQRALDPPTRAVSITAVMPTLPATKKLALKFELLRRSAQARLFSEVSGHDLRTWVHPDNPTLGQRPGDVWILNHPVVNLLAPAFYRFRVSFRWIGARGRVLRDAVRESPICYEPELRPDLLVRSVTVQAVPGSPQQNAYIAVIGNAGATAAGPFDVRFTDAGSVQDRTVGSLSPHATIRERFVGAACRSASAPTVTVDPSHQIDVSSRSKASLTATCPAS